jgi:hypothetical protein
MRKNAVTRIAPSPSSNLPASSESGARKSSGCPPLRRCSPRKPGLRSGGPSPMSCSAKGLRAPWEGTSPKRADTRFFTTHPPSRSARAPRAAPQRHRATRCRAVTPSRRASLVASPIREARDTLRSDALMHREALLRGVALRRTFLRRHQARVERAGRDEQRLEHGRADVGSDLLRHGPSTFRARSQKAGRRVGGSSAHTSPVRAREQLFTSAHGA